MMKKITDERLKLKNLENIRVLFLVQTIGIIGILGYDLVTTGMNGMTSNPLWYVLILTGVVSAYLSMSISVDVYCKIEVQTFATEKCRVLHLF